MSPGNAADDTIKKLRLYHRAAIPHYWIVDPRDATLTVMRWSADGEIVRPEPFHEVELSVGTLFGDDPPE